MPAATSIEQTSTQARSGKQLLLSPLFAVVLAAHILGGDDYYPLVTRLCAGVIGCITVWLVLREQRSHLPGLPFLAIQFWMHMARPVFKKSLVFGVRGPFSISEASWELAGIATLVAFVAVFVGAQAGERIGVRSRGFVSTLLPARLAEGGVPRAAARAYAVGGLALQTILNVRSELIPSALVTPADTLSSATLLIGILFIDARRYGDLSGRVWLYGALAWLAANGLATGMLGGALLPAAALILYEWTTRRRLPWALIVVGAIVYLVLAPAKSVYRQNTWGRGYVSIDERASNWADAVEGSWTSDNDESLNEHVGTASDRLTTFPYVALAFEAVPRHIPFAGPERWLNIPSLMIPRVFWPGKPTLVSYFNNDYTLTFGLQTSEMTRTTSINLPMIADGYWRLGWLGVVIEALVLGCWLGWLVGVADLRSASSLLLCVTLLIWVRPDSFVAGHIVGLLPLCGGTFAALWGLQVLSILWPNKPEHFLGKTMRKPTTLRAPT